MIKLPLEFTSGAGGFAAEPLDYKQVVRSDKAAVYQRSRNGIVKDYEVFKIKVLKKGTQIFQKTVAEDEERYPSSTNFGFIAWSISGGPSAMNAAIAKFDDLNKEPIEKEAVVDDSVPKVPGKRGRKRKERNDLVFPNSDFSMKDLLKLNTSWSQPLAYIQLQKFVKSGSVIEVGRVKNESGRGRASVIYRKVD